MNDEMMKIATLDISTYNAKYVVFTPDHDALKVFFYRVDDIARSTKKAWLYHQSVIDIPFRRTADLIQSQGCVNLSYPNLISIYTRLKTPVFKKSRREIANKRK